MAKKKDTNDASLISAHADIKATAKVAVTDVAGLGALGKSPAGREIARNMSSALADSVRLASTAFMGARATEVEAKRIVTLAEAESSARLIADDTEAELLRRAVERMRSDEIRKQTYIEQSTRKAILIADAKYHDVLDPAIDPELILSWIDGVKDAHGGEVRRLYEELLAAHTSPSVRTHNQ